MLTQDDLQQIGQITTKIVKEELKEGLKPLSQSIDDLSESVAFIKDNAVTKQELEEQLAPIKASMVAKTYLDEKIGTLRGDMVQLIRKEDDKVNAVVDSLEEEKALPSQRIETIRSHHVFPAPPHIASSPI